MATDDFKAEVSNGYLLIAVKIPSVDCAACGKSYSPKISAAEVEAAFRGNRPLMSVVSCAPWCGEPKWGFVRLGAAGGYKRALVCDDCFAPIAAVESAAEEAKSRANAAVGTTVRAW